MNRAYATLELRAVDDEQRIIEGIASTDAVDDYDTILEPKGVRYSLPLPLLWQHRVDTPVGEVYEVNVSTKRITFKARLAKIADPGSLKDDVERAYQAVKAGLVRGVSVGFKPGKTAGGTSLSDPLRFIEWVWRELSLVTLPANTEATISAVRSADRLFASSGNPSPGVPGVSTTPKPPGHKMTIQEQITQHENSRAAKVARQQALMARAAEAGTTLDQTEAEEYDTLQSEVEAVDGHLVRLSNLQRANREAATPVTGVTTTATGSATRGGVPVVSVKPNVEPGITFARHVMALAACKGNTFEAAEYAKRTWGDAADEIYGGLRNGIMQLRTAVAPGTTAQATFAAPLVPTNYANEFLEMLRPATLLGRIPGLRRVPFNTSMPAQTAGGTYKWVGQGKMKPVTNAQYAAVTLGFAKASGIIVLTKELVKLSTPSAEAAVRDEMTKGIVQFLDGQFVDPTVAAVSNQNPASITNGVTGTAATDTDVAAARSDIAARIAAFAAANYGLNGLVILMSESMAFSLGTMINSVGQPAFPGLSINGGSILGVPVVTSETVGAQIVFVHASSILYADDGGVEIDISEEASVQLDDTPTEPTDASAVMTSLWQANLVGIRAELFRTWGKARSTAVDRITSAAYVP